MRRAMYHVIVEVDQLYNNTKKVGDVELVVNTNEQLAEYTNREAKVIAAPDEVDLAVGDTIIAHHNLFRKRYDFQGNKVPSWAHVQDNMFKIPVDSIYLYKKDDGEWIAPSPFCFVKPIKSEDDMVGSIIVGTNFDSYKGNEKNLGIMAFPNEDLEQMGVAKGSMVVFANNSEYEFEIDGEIYYKMNTKDILSVLDEGIK